MRGRGGKGKKVKTGCQTCKYAFWNDTSDEAKPVCRRCLSSDRICDGYGIWGGGGNTYAQRYPIQFAEKEVTPLSSITRVQLTTLRDDHERQHLEWFICNSVKKFPGIFSSDFWHSLVIPATAAETILTVIPPSGASA